MAPSRRFDGASLDGYYLRGMADIQAHQFPAAEAEFRSLLAHPYAEPSSASLPVAHLQLGRVLAQEGNKAAAADEYRTFLSLWKNADPDQPLLKQAKMELQSLSTAART